MHKAGVMKPPRVMESGTSSGQNVAAISGTGTCPRNQGLATNPGPVLSFSQPFSAVTPETIGARNYHAGKDCSVPGASRCEHCHTQISAF